MFLIVLLLLSTVTNCSSEPAAAAVSSFAGSVLSTVVSNAGHALLDGAESALCEAALSLFSRKTDADISKYVRPQLSTIIKDATSSPDNKDDDDNSPQKVIKKIVSGDISIAEAPIKHIEELVMAAVQKTLEAKEKELADKASQIEGMFTPKSTACISAVSGVILAIVGSLAGAFGTKSAC